MSIRSKSPIVLLVPYDGSEPSEKALGQALALAASLAGEAEITLLNVVQEIVLPTTVFERPRFRSKLSGEEISSEALGKELTEDLKGKMATMLDKKKLEIQRKHPGKSIRVRTKTLLGYPVDEILRHAKEENVDMIVIGSVGLSGVQRLKALGSISRGVTERATCPVLVVH
jgi:nucleotide-binding universal stress UspA family protein